MHKKPERIHRRISGILYGLLVGTPTASQAALDDLVAVFGRSTDTQFQEITGNKKGIKSTPKKTCETIRDFLELNDLVEVTADGTVGIIVPEVLMGDLEPGDEVPDQLKPLGQAAGYLSSCDDEFETETAVYTIVFTTCSMTAMYGSTFMRWTVPPDAPEAIMIVFDAASGQVFESSYLESGLGAVQTLAKGKAEKQTIKGPSGSEEFELLIEIGMPGNYVATHEKFVAQGYSHQYKGTVVGMPFAEGEGVTAPSIESKGTAYIASDVPGSDVIRQFYRNFRDHVAPAAGKDTLLSAPIEQMAGLAEKGMPLKNVRKTTMSMGGILGQFGGAMAQRSESTDTISAIRVHQSGASQRKLCGNTVFPEGVTVNSMDQIMAGQNGDAMNEYSKAMEQITPEQLAMLEQMGIGVPGGAPGGGAAAAVVPGDAGTATAAAATASRSAALMTDDVAQSVQRHLHALGYDPGNTDGDVSTETVIAISQFQAEKRLEVTGEVSPQLLGILSAEVDQRRGK
jgi:hypothetical protein